MKPAIMEPFIGSEIPQRQTQLFKPPLKKRPFVNPETQQDQSDSLDVAHVQSHSPQQSSERKPTVNAAVQRDQVALPTKPEKTREVLGNVQHREGGTPRPHPPPSRQPPIDSSMKIRYRKRRGISKKQLGNNEDSDSDSDSDSGRHVDNEASTAALRKQNVEDTAMHDENLADREAMERENQARMELFQVLKNVGAKWDDVSHIRRSHRKNGEFRREQLLRRHWKERDDAHAQLMRSNAADPQALQEFHNYYDNTTRLNNLHEQIKEWNYKRQDCLDGALYGAIEERLREHGPETKPTKTLEEILLHVESDLIESFGAFDRPWRAWGLQPYQRTKPDPPLHDMSSKRQFLNRDVVPHERLAKILGEMYLEWWVELASDPSVPQVNLRETITARLNINYQSQRRSDQLSQIRSFFVMPYISRIGAGMSRALEDALATGTDPRAVRHDFPDHVDVIQRVKTSRTKWGSSLSDQYMDWMTSSFCAEYLEEICKSWEVVLRKETCYTYRKTMASIVDIRQEFCPGIRKRGIVSLVLLKGGYPASIKDVSATELQSMGWFEDVNGAYWRYEYESAYSRGTKAGEKAIYRVTMEGEVLGMLSPNGNLIGWEDRNEVREDVVLRGWLSNHYAT
ncbi:hypothetical protein BDP55DRAFT_274935 [Colletotrichum godetiae]|uniref:Uncharacterized protein n=1 Tax=Colletotrichum godetiae TaxID=1209918 RepID=A0AAJ0ADQ3_9PEZI|nr:uncharacterized protein BDP55DRAFT_274935 [Colletotrichum godetiae]KAK1671997.1 hypothetical protein BDP55DRAFT_274935 [Colletotrichum godetiae]